MKQSGRTVVVTGASAGVGRAAVRAFARNGDDVALIARGREGLEGARREVEAEGRRALVIPCDVSDADAVRAAAARVENELGPIDVWVNDAMVTVMAEIKDTPPEEFRRVTEVTYLGAVYGTLAALERMLWRDRGVIVQVGSALSYRPIPLQAAYCGAKFALRGFMGSLRAELEHRKSHVHVTMVQLPGLNTPQFDWSRVHGEAIRNKPQPVPPIYQPEVAAEAILFASRHRRREVWVGGKASAIMGLNKFGAAVGDLYLAKTAYEGQQTSEPLDPDRRDNLFSPVPEDRGAHGRFDDRARAHSPQLWAVKHRPWLLLGAAAVAGAAAYAATRA